RHRRDVREHVRVSGIGQRAIALAGLDAAPQLIGLARPPDRAEVVVVLAQVAHRLRSNAAGPDVPVGRDLRRGHTRHARDHLALPRARARYGPGSSCTESRWWEC